MNTFCAFILQAVVPAFWAFTGPPGHVVDFETMPVGTEFGSLQGHMPGDLVLSQNGIDMRIQPFRLSSFVGFYRAQIGGPFDPYFATTPLETNNISVEFDFQDIGFVVEEVSFEFMEFGGAGNFAVNDSLLYELASLTLVPHQVAPGVTAYVEGGLITLTGPIHQVLVGGQELAIDNVRAVPEPVTWSMLILGLIVAVRRTGKVHQVKSTGLEAPAAIPYLT